MVNHNFIHNRCWNLGTGTQIAIDSIPCKYTQADEFC